MGVPFDFISSQSNVKNNDFAIHIEDGIIVITYSHQLKYITFPIAQKIVSERKKIANGKTYPILTVVNQLKGLEPRAKNYLSSQEASELGAACAILATNFFATLIANFYIRVNPPKTPIKLFTNKKRAMIWLKQFRNLN